MSIFSDHECGALDDYEFEQECRRMNREDRYEREHLDEIRDREAEKKAIAMKKAAEMEKEQAFAEYKEKAIAGALKSIESSCRHLFYQGYQKGWEERGDDGGAWIPCTESEPIINREYFVTFRAKTWNMRAQERIWSEPFIEIIEWMGEEAGWDVYSLTERFGISADQIKITAWREAPGAYQEGENT